METKCFGFFSSLLNKCILLSKKERKGNRGVICLYLDIMQKLCTHILYLEQQIYFKFQNFFQGNKNQLPSLSTVQVAITDILGNTCSLALDILSTFLDKMQYFSGFPFGSRTNLGVRLCYNSIFFLTGCNIICVHLISFSSFMSKHFQMLFNK